MTTPSTDEQPISPLVADLITASLRQSQWTANTLIDNLTEQAETAEATIDAIRAGVGKLLNSDYMPTSAAITRALYPADAMVARFRKAGEQS